MWPLAGAGSARKNQVPGSFLRVDRRRNPIHHLTKTSVSGGGLGLGETQDYEVELEPGEYLYSCPLNPTPDYRLVVKG